MEKIWLQHYPEEIPADINPRAYSSVMAMFDQTVKTYGSRPAVTAFGVTLNYLELSKKSQQLAAYFQSIGLKKGDRVALMMPNVIQYLISLYAALRAGLVVVNVNPLYTERELEHQLGDAQPRAIIVLENFAKTVEQALPRLSIEQVIIARIGDMQPLPKSILTNWVVKRVKKAVPEYEIPGAITFTKALAVGRRCKFAPVELGLDDLAFLQYTGGTTGVSKGAMLTHGNIVANIEQAFAWLKPQLRLGYERSGVILPLYHVFSLLANAFVFMRAGSCCVLIANPRDVPALIESFRRERFTVLMVVNTLVNTLLGREAFRELDLSELRVVIAGGMALQGAVAKRWLDLTGVPILEGFGLTEASPITCINPVTATHRYNGSIGLPVPSTEVMVVDDDGCELVQGEEGELCFKGPQIMQGYWNMPEETARVLFNNGWLKTGDIGRVDEKGFVYIVDRKKDMIDVAGFNVYPNEVEGIIAHHPGVSEVAIIGEPHQITGEMVKAYIVKEDKSITKADIIAFCKENLVSYKVPKRIEFCEGLPKNNVGKVLRRVLRATVDS